MLQDTIVQTFRTATDEQKAVMVGTIPAEMLSVGSDIYANLGESSSVWLAYLHRIGSEGVKTLPSDVVESHIIPLLHLDESPHTIVTLLKAGIHVDNAIAFLQTRTGAMNGDFQTSTYTDGLRATREKSLPVVLEMLQVEDPYKLQYAFHAFTIEEWTDNEAIQQVSDAVLVVLKRSEEEFIIEHCARVLAVTNPEALVRFAIDTMKSWGDERVHDHPVRKAGKHIVTAYEAVTLPELKQEFVLASIATNMPWFDLDRWGAIVILAKMGEDTFKNALVSTSNYTRTNLGGAIRFVRDQPDDEVTLVIKVVTAVVHQLLDDAYDPSNLTGFLAQAQNTFTEDDYVEFMVKVQNLGGDVGELSQYHYYDACTPEDVVAYMARLKGVAKTDAALMLLHKLDKTRNGYSRHKKAFAAAMNVIVSAYTQQGQPIRERSDDNVQKVPVKHWKSYLETILQDGKPFWAVRFAVFALKTIGDDHELANQTLARMMLVEDEKIQWYISRYLNS